MKRLLFLISLTLMFSCKKEYSVENSPVQIQPQPQVPTIPDISGIWVGKLYYINRPNSIDYCWKITKDSFFAYDRAITPRPIPDLTGTWKLYDNIFKARFFYSTVDAYRDSAILTNDYKKMTGIEVWESGNRDYGTFVMNKK